MRYGLILLALLTSPAAAETYLTFSVGSYHTKDTSKYNPVNPGLGIERRVSERWALAGGYYTPSCVNQHSTHIWKDLRFVPVSRVSPMRRNELDRRICARDQVFDVDAFFGQSPQQSNDFALAEFPAPFGHRFSRSPSGGSSTLRHVASFHGIVKHQIKEYVNRENPVIHTNTIEGFFSIFKRGMRGVYQHCAHNHLHRYLAEFDFRYNNRVALGVVDSERADKLLKGVVGKRLTYQTTAG